jgi:predicted transcriptional regulator
MENPDKDDITLECATSIVAAYLANNKIQKENLAALILDTFGALTRTKQPQAPAEALRPAAPIKRSVQPDHIICLEDGKKFKSLKRHLMTHYNMTPEDYRQKWGLPADYPMVAPNYALARSELAKKMGLGRREEPAAVAEPARSATKGKKAATKKTSMPKKAGS